MAGHGSHPTPALSCHISPDPTQTHYSKMSTEANEETDRLEGWWKCHRQLIQSEVFMVPELLQLWIWLLCRASHSKQGIPMQCGKGTRLVKLNPGQVVIGRFTSASSLGWKPSTFRDRLERIKSMGLVSIVSDRQWSVVSITKWNTFQEKQVSRTTADQSKADDSQKQRNKPTKTKAKKTSEQAETTTGRQPDDSRPTTERQPPDTYKNAKNAKNDQNAKNSSTSSMSISFDPNFSLLANEAAKVLIAKNGTCTDGDWLNVCRAVYVGLQLVGKKEVAEWIKSASTKPTLLAGYFTRTAIKVTESYDQSFGFNFDAMKREAPALPFDQSLLPASKPKTKPLERERIRNRLFLSDKAKWSNTTEAELEREVDRIIELENSRPELIPFVGRVRA
jgi:hypothetical protein